MRDHVAERVDVLVVGAGPAGLTAANLLSLSDAAPSVTLVDARGRIGTPLRCAELTYPNLFQLMGCRPRPGWIRWQLSRSDDMLVIDRSRTELELSRIVAGQGVDVRDDTTLVDIGEYHDGARQVTLQNGSGRQRISAGFVIAADGVSSQTARLAGLVRHLKPNQLCSCLAYRIEGAKLRDPDSIFFDFRAEIFPYYFWIIPSGPDEANVGLGVTSSRGLDLDELLSRLIETSPGIAGGRITERVVGSYPSTMPLRQPVADGMLVVGGAGQFVDAITGEGIRQAAYTGRAAAATYLEARGVGLSAEHLAGYPARLREVYEHLERQVHDMRRVRRERRAGLGAAPAARPPTAGSREQKAFVNGACTGCTGCAPVCPTLAIRVAGDGIEVLEDDCIGCRHCVNDCAILGVQMG